MMIICRFSSTEPCGFRDFTEPHSQNIIYADVIICKEKGDYEKAEKYEQIKINLKKALNTKAWDGRWYKRAYMDDGNWLGSMENYDANGNKIGESRPDCFGNMNHYNENGHKTGHSDKGIFGGWNHFDE